MPNVMERLRAKGYKVYANPGLDMAGRFGDALSDIGSDIADTTLPQAAGALAGGVLGGLGGAALGSFVPAAGTTAGAAAGAVAGAGLGKDFVTDTSMLATELFGEGPQAGYEWATGKKWMTPEDLNALPPEQAQRVNREQQGFLARATGNVSDMAEGLVQLPARAVLGAGNAAMGLASGRMTPTEAALMPVDFTAGMVAGAGESALRTLTGTNRAEPLSVALDFAGGMASGVAGNVLDQTTLGLMGSPGKGVFAKTRALETGALEAIPGAKKAADALASKALPTLTAGPRWAREGGVLNVLDPLEAQAAGSADAIREARYGSEGAKYQAARDVEQAMMGMTPEQGVVGFDVLTSAEPLMPTRRSLLEQQRRAQQSFDALSTVAPNERTPEQIQFLSDFESGGSLSPTYLNAITPRLQNIEGGKVLKQGETAPMKALASQEQTQYIRQQRLVESLQREREALEKTQTQIDDAARARVLANRQVQAQALGMETQRIVDNAAADVAKADADIERAATLRREFETAKAVLGHKAKELNWHNLLEAPQAELRALERDASLSRSMKQKLIEDYFTERDDIETMTGGADIAQYDPDVIKTVSQKDRLDPTGTRMSDELLGKYELAAFNEAEGLTGTKRVTSAAGLWRYLVNQAKDVKDIQSAIERMREFADYDMFGAIVAERLGDMALAQKQLDEFDLVERVRWEARNALKEVEGKVAGWKAPSFFDEATPPRVRKAKQAEQVVDDAQGDMFDMGDVDERYIDDDFFAMQDDARTAALDFDVASFADEGLDVVENAPSGPSVGQMSARFKDILKTLESKATTAKTEARVLESTATQAKRTATQRAEAARYRQYKREAWAGDPTNLLSYVENAILTTEDTLAQVQAKLVTASDKKRPFLEKQIKNIEASLENWRLERDVITSTPSIENMRTYLRREYDIALADEDMSAAAKIRNALRKIDGRDYVSDAEIAAARTFHEGKRVANAEALIKSYERKIAATDAALKVIAQEKKKLLSKPSTAKPLPELAKALEEDRQRGIQETMQLKLQARGNSLDAFDGEAWRPVQQTASVLHPVLGNADELLRLHNEGKLKFQGPDADALNEYVLPVVVMNARQSKELVQLGLLDDDTLKMTGLSYLNAIYDPRVLQRAKERTVTQSWIKYASDVVADPTLTQQQKIQKMQTALSSAYGALPASIKSEATTLLGITGQKPDLSRFRRAFDKYNKSLSQQLDKGRIGGEKIKDLYINQASEQASLIAEYKTYQQIADDPKFRPLVRDVVPDPEKIVTTTLYKGTRGQKTVKAYREGERTWIYLDPTEKRGALPRWGDLGGKLVDRSLYDVLDGGNAYRRTMFDKVLSVMKKNMVIRNAGSHLNVVISNIFNNYVDGGLMGVGEYARAYKDVAAKGPVFDALMKEGLGYGGHGSQVLDDAAKALGKHTDPMDGFLYELEQANKLADSNWQKVGNLAAGIPAAYEAVSGLGPSTLLDAVPQYRQKLENFIGMPVEMGAIFQAHELATRYALARRHLERVAKSRGVELAAVLDDSQQVKNAVKKAIQIQFDYNEIPTWAMALRQWGIAPFISYPVKATGLFSRWMWENPTLFRRGGVYGAQDYALSSAQEQERRDAQAMYLQGKTLPVGEDYRLNLQGMQFLQLLPFSSVADLTTAGSQNNLASFGQQVVPIHLRPLAAIGFGTDPWTRERIYTINDTDGEKLAKAASYLAASYGPGWARVLENNVLPAAQNMPSKGRKTALSVEQALARLIGIRIEKDDPTASNRQAAALTKASIQQARADMQNLAKAGGLTPERRKAIQEDIARIRAQSATVRARKYR